MSSKKKSYNQVKTIRMVLQLVPFVTGMIGLYVISTWSIGLRVENDIQYNEGVYYFGLSLILIALQIPLFLELYRRRTKKFMMHRVLIAFVCIAGTLLVVANNLTSKVNVSLEEVIEFDLLD